MQFDQHIPKKVEKRRVRILSAKKMILYYEQQIIIKYFLLNFAKSNSARGHSPHLLSVVE